MKRVLEFIAEMAKRGGRWLSVPSHFVISLFSLAFLASLVLWSLADHGESFALFFPESNDRGIKAERRILPQRSVLETRAELVASENLLGPFDPSLKPAFPPGVRVNSVLFRKGQLYLDLSEDAALAEPVSLKLGLAALERTLSYAFPTVRKVVLTIGGFEPYAMLSTTAAGTEGKSDKKN